MTVLSFKKNPILHFMPILVCCLYTYVYIILTPHEYYRVLPALATTWYFLPLPLMWLLSQGLLHQLCTLHLLSNSIQDRKNILKMNKEVRMLLPKKDLIQVEYIGKINNYYEDIYIPPYNNTTSHTYTL